MMMIMMMIMIIIKHIILACPVLAKEQYINRRDKVCADLHFYKCKDTGVKLNIEHWYDCVPKSFETSHEGKATILWNIQV
jgi:hypothetical protein